jgi:hypothetical protein
LVESIRLFCLYPPACFFRAHHFGHSGSVTSYTVAALLSLLTCSWRNSDANAFRPIGNPDWNDALPVLRVEDVRGLSEALMGDSEGRSWIWTTHTGVLADGTDAGDEGTYASLNHLIAELSMHHSSKG